MRKIFTLFILLLLLPVTVGAQTTANDINYNYYTWDDTNHALTRHSGTATATDVTESDTSWGENDDQEHWYVVNGDITISSRISVTGDVHLILADGCKLTANSGIQVQDDDNDISNGSSNSLTIYAQSEGDGMGVLAASGGEKMLALAETQEALVARLLFMVAWLVPQVVMARVLAEASTSAAAKEVLVARFIFMVAWLVLQVV